MSEAEIAELEILAEMGITTLTPGGKECLLRLIADWRKRGERIEALRRDLEFYQLEAVARTGTNARMKP